MYTTQEKKYFDFAEDEVSMAVTWSFADVLPSISVGTSASQRIGNKIFLHSIEWQVFMKPLTTMAVSGCLGRTVVVHSKCADNIAMTSGVIWQQDTIDTLRNTPTQSRVTILKDVSHTMVPTAVTSTGTIAAVGPRRLMHLKIFPRKVIAYSNTGGTFADMVKDDYLLAWVADAAAGCNFDVRGKVIFSDA